MNENVIDTLKIKIVGDSSNAVSSLDKLIDTIDRIKTVTSGGNKGLSGLDKHLSKISSACDKINAGALSKIYKLADGLRALNDVGNLKISSKFADRILDLGAAVELLQDLDMSKLTDLANGLKALNNVGQVKIPNLNVNAATNATTSAPAPSPATNTMANTNFSGMVAVQSQVVSATTATNGLKNSLSNVLSIFGNLKNSVTGLASSIKQTVANSTAWRIMESGVKGVASAIGTLAVGMGKLGTISLSFAKYIAKGITAPSRLAISAVQGLAGKVGNLFRMFKKRAMYRAMNLVISTITKGFSEGTKHVYEYSKAVGTALAPSMDKLATSGLYLKNSLGAMVAPLMNMLAPAVDKLVDKFVDLLNVINQTFATLSGASTWTKAIKYPTEYASETKKAAAATDKLKKSVLGFDELNQLQNNSKSNSGNGKGNEDYTLMFEEKQVTDFATKIENVLGGIFKPFKKAWEKEGAKTIKSIQDKFKAMKTFIGTIGSTFKEVWTNGTGETVLTNMLQIFQSINQISTNLYTNLTKAWKANNNGTKLTQNVMDAFVSLQNVVKGFFDSTAKWIGNLNFTPIMTAVTNLTNKFKPFVDLIGGALLDAYNNVLLPLGSWVIEEAAPGAIDALSEAFEALIALLKPVKEGFNDLWTAMKPIIEWIEDTAMVIIDGFKTLFSKVADVINKKGDDIKGIFKGIGDTLKSVWTIVEPIFLALKDLVSGVFDYISEIVGDRLGAVIDWIKGLADFVAGVFTLDWKRAWDGIKNIFKGFWEYIKSIGKTVFDVLAAPFKLAWEGIKVVWEKVQPFFEALWNGIKKVFSPVAGWFKNIFSGAWKGIKAVFNGVKDFFAKVWEWIKAPFKTAGKWFWNIFANLWKGVKGCFNGVKDFFVKVWEWIKAPFKTAGKWFWNIFANLWKGVKGCFNGVKEFFGKVWEWIKAPFVNAVKWFSATFNKVKDAICRVWSEIVDFITELWNSIKSFFNMFSVTGVDDTKVKKDVRAALKKQGKTYTDAEWEKAWKTQKFASGGLVNEGQMFIAREAGPELVGTIGNRTAVMNNDQIVNSVAQGVADANAEQNALLREEISILRKILAKDYGSGNSSYGDILGELSRINRRNGKTVVSIGV